MQGMNLLLSVSEPQIAAVQYVLDTLFGGLMLFIFTQVPATKKNITSMILLILVSCSCILVTILSRNQGNIGILYAIFVHLPFILWFVLGFKVPVSLTLTSHFLTYNLLSSRLFFGNISLHVLRRVVPGILPAVAIRIGWILTGPLVVFISLYLLVHRFPVHASKNRTERMLLLRVLGGAYVLTQAMHLSGMFNGQADPVFVSLIFSILLFAFVISVGMYSSVVKEAEAIKARNTVYAQQTEGLAILTDAMADYLQSTARLRHDQRHFLTLIDLHSRTGNIHAIRELVKANLEVLDSSPSRVTGDDIVDGIITLFKKRAEAHGVSIEMIGASLLDLPLGRDDLCLLLSNCLENAIEATRKVTEGARQIMISVTRNSDTGTLALLVRNPFHEPVKFSGTGIPISDRGDGHGFGTRSMKLIVNKYEGLCNFSVEENQFYFRAVFFVPKQTYSRQVS